MVKPYNNDDSRNRKNVILVTYDGLRQDHISYFGYHRNTTPNIDWLARNGISFTDITTSSFTKCSITSLLTSMDCNEHNISQHKDILSNKFLTLPEVFRENGYITAGFSATPMVTKNLNYNQGFNYFNDFNRENLEYVRSSIVTNDVVDFIENQVNFKKNMPFFIYIHFEEPHPPWYSPSPWSLSNDSNYCVRPFNIGCTYLPTKEEISSVKTNKIDLEYINKYDGSILQADRQLGSILSILDKLNLSNKTMVAVSTDHGYELLDRFSFTHARNPFNEVTKVFFVLYDSKSISEGIKNIPGRIIDIGPTLLANSGLNIPAEFKGRNLLDAKFTAPEYRFAQSYGANLVIYENFKLIHFFPFYKAIPNGYKDYMLFNLSDDPKELYDLSEKEPIIFKKLIQTLNLYESQISTQKESYIESETLERLKTLGYIK